MFRIVPVMLLLGTVAAAQTPLPLPIRVPVISPALIEFLQLSPSQVGDISRANADLQAFVQQQQQRMFQVQLEITEWTQKSPIDAMALGIRYAEVEAIRREMNDNVARTRDRIRGLLNDAQKARVKALDDARKAQQLICEAQYQNILDPAPPA